MDVGRTWHVRNKRLWANYLPDPAVEVGHDPHLLVACPTRFETMWHHCGIFVSKDDAKSWMGVTQEGGPANFGFAVQMMVEELGKISGQGFRKNLVMTLSIGMPLMWIKTNFVSGQLVVIFSFLKILEKAGIA